MDFQISSFLSRVELDIVAFLVCNISQGYSCLSQRIELTPDTIILSNPAKLSSTSEDGLLQNTVDCVAPCISRENMYHICSPYFFSNLLL